MSYVTPHLTTPSTGTPSLSSTLSFSPALRPFLSEPKPCADPRSSKVMSPNSVPKTRITSTSPKTRSLRNTKIYVSNPCSSTNRAWRRPTILLRASWHRSLTRTWTMSKFVLCWLHQCTHWSEKQLRNNRKIVSLLEKTWCPVHLKIWLVQENLSRCLQAKIGWIKTRFPTEKISLTTSTGCWEQRTFLQILEPGKCCEISSWW